MKTNHSSFSECTDVVKPLTAEEKEDMKKKFERHFIFFVKQLFEIFFRIQERIVLRRKEQQIAEQQKEIEMEKKRIVDGKALLDIKQKYVDLIKFNLI